MHIDLLDPAGFRGGQPYEFYAWLRESEPVHWNPEPDGPGFWVLTRHADIKALEGNAELFSSMPTTVIGNRPVGDETHHQMLFTDPPWHTAHRRFLSPELSPIAVRSERDAMVGLVNAVIDEVIERGECDFIPDISGRMASYVIADLLGLPREESLILFHASATLTRGFPMVPGSPEAKAIEVLYQHGTEAWDRALAGSADAPGMLARLARGAIGEVPVDRFQFQLDFHLLVNAGSDTSRNALATGLDTLFTFPDQLALLRANPDLVPQAVEEILRWTPPIVYQRRTATADTEIHGQPIAKGDKVVSFYGAGNRDPRVFDRPEIFDITRTVNPHLTFGAGRHFCLGSHLARLELETMLRALVERMPDLEPAGPMVWEELPSVPAVLGPHSLPVRFTPGPRVGQQAEI